MLWKELSLRLHRLHPPVVWTVTPAADYQQRQRTETEIVKEAVRHTVVAMLGIVTIEESGQTVTELKRVPDVNPDGGSRCLLEFLWHVEGRSRERRPSTYVPKVIPRS
ncbi:hypothetical protein VUR80DRAFT_4209 [Thermomyces stellatus]